MSSEYSSAGQSQPSSEYTRADLTMWLGDQIDSVSLASDAASIADVLGELLTVQAQVHAAVSTVAALGSHVRGSHGSAVASASDIATAATGAMPRMVRNRARVGGWLLDFPLFAAAYRSGALHAEHVRELHKIDNPRTRTALIEAQQDFIDAATTLPWSQFIHVIRYWLLAADPDGTEPKHQHQKRRLSFTRHGDGTVTGRFRLDAVNGQAMTNAILAHAQRLATDDKANDRPAASHVQYLADALVDLCQHGTTAIAGGTTSVPQPLVHIVMSKVVADRLLESVADQLGDSESGNARFAGPAGGWNLHASDPDQRCELADGTPIHPTAALGALYTGALTRAVLDGQNRVLQLGRQSRSFPRYLHQALIIQGRGQCQAPGCDAPLPWLQADHIIPWSRGGPTNLGNGQSLCQKHNHQKADQLPPDPPDPDPDEHPSR